jgi:PEP-CTERM motif
VRSIFYSVPVIFLMAVAPGARAGIILTNGNFAAEGTEYSAALGGIFAATGWTNQSSLNIQAAITAAGSEGTAALTENYLRLASDNNGSNVNGFIVQDLGTMIAGQTYTFIGDALGGSSTNTTWGATVELTSDGSATPATVYATQVLSGFTAGQVATGALDVSFTATGANDGQELFIWIMTPNVGGGVATRGGLANIQLTVSPEPGTIAMIGSGLAALLLVVRRRR